VLLACNLFRDGIVLAMQQKIRQAILSGAQRKDLRSLLRARAND